MSEVDIDISVQRGSEITIALDVSPIKFQFKRKIEEVDESTVQQMRWKLKR